MESEESILGTNEVVAALKDLCTQLSDTPKAKIPGVLVLGPKHQHKQRPCLHKGGPCRRLYSLEGEIRGPKTNVHPVFHGGK